MIKLGFLTQSLEYEKVGNNVFVESELKRILKNKHEFEREDASTHVGLSKSQSRKTSEAEIQENKKKNKKNEVKIEENHNFDAKYEEMLIKMSEELNFNKERLLSFLNIKENPEIKNFDYDNTSGNNKILRFFLKDSLILN